MVLKDLMEHEFLASSSSVVQSLGAANMKARSPQLFLVIVSYGTVWYEMAWHGMAWHGMVWYGMVWHGMVWYGMVWYGMV